MPHVPGTGRTRTTHRRNTRRSHYHSGYLGALTGFEETYDQSVIDGVPPSPVVYPEGSIPPSAVDHVPPALPTGLAISSDTVVAQDGTSALRLIATLTQPADGDLFGSYVEVTAESDGNPDPDLEQPLWTNPAVIFIAKDLDAGQLLGVRGMTDYWARAYSADIFGNVSSYTATVKHVTGKDTEAPAVPQNVVVSPGLKALGVAWDLSVAPDLMLYEVRYAVDDGTGTAPNTATWQYLRGRSTVVWLGNLTIGQKYWVQVRAVDFSGNVATSQANPAPVDWLSFPEAGWSGLMAGTPVEIGAADFAANSILARVLSAGSISADDIKTGYLKVNTADAAMADGVEVWNAGVRVGKWDETGLYIGKTALGLPADLSGSDYVRVTDAGITVYLAGQVTSAITPDGINATAINFGTLPGGHNLLQNSSFELADFVASAPVTKTWDVAADWTATQVTNTNATNGAGAVSMTGTSY